MLPLFTINNSLMPSLVSLPSLDPQLVTIIFYKKPQLLCSLSLLYHPAKVQSWLSPTIHFLVSPPQQPHGPGGKCTTMLTTLTAFTVNSLPQISNGPSMLPDDHTTLPLSGCTSFLEFSTEPAHSQLVTLPHSSLDTSG